MAMQEGNITISNNNSRSNFRKIKVSRTSSPAMKNKKRPTVETTSNVPDKDEERGSHHSPDSRGMQKEERDMPQPQSLQSMIMSQWKHTFSLECCVLGGQPYDYDSDKDNTPVIDNRASEQVAHNDNGKRDKPEAETNSLAQYSKFTPSTDEEKDLSVQRNDEEEKERDDIEAWREFTGSQGWEDGNDDESDGSSTISSLTNPTLMTNTSIKLSTMLPMDDTGGTFFGSGKDLLQNPIRYQPHDLRLDDDIRTRKSISNFQSDKTVRSLTKNGYEAYIQEEYDLAISIYEKIRDLKAKSYGDLHCKVADSMMRLALIHEAKSSFSEALVLKAAALSIYQRSKKRLNMIKTNNALTSIGNSYLQFADFPQALRCYKESLEITEVVFADQPLRIAHSLDNVGSLQAILGKYKTAIGFFQRALQLREEALGEYAIVVADTKVALGEVLFASQKEDSAVLTFRDAIRVYTANNFKNDHPKVKRVMRDMNIIDSGSNMI